MYFLNCGCLLFFTAAVIVLGVTAALLRRVYIALRGLFR